MKFLLIILPILLLLLGGCNAKVPTQTNEQPQKPVTVKQPTQQSTSPDDILKGYKGTFIQITDNFTAIKNNVDSNKNIDAEDITFKLQDLINQAGDNQGNCATFPTKQGISGEYTNYALSLSNHFCDLGKTITEYREALIVKYNIDTVPPDINESSEEYVASQFNMEKIDLASVMQYYNLLKQTHLAAN